MEPFKQRENNQYDKNLEKIDTYLVSVIHRFFNTKNAESDIETENIISAAVARYKGSLTYKDKGVRSVNGSEGIVNVSCYTLGLMEKEFHKSAFNSNFGNAPGTSCHGDDIRLKDPRTPKGHAHSIKDITNLGMVLHSLNTVAAGYGKHVHMNSETLDKILCTKPTDLKDIENAESILKQKLDTLRQKEAELEDIKLQFEHYLKRIRAVKGL